VRVQEKRFFEIQQKTTALLRATQSEKAMTNIKVFCYIIFVFHSEPLSYYNMTVY